MSRIAPVRDSAVSVCFAPAQSLETNGSCAVSFAPLNSNPFSLFFFVNSLSTHSSFSIKHASRLWSLFHAKKKNERKRICNWNVYFTCIVRYGFDPIIRSDYWNLSRWHQVDDERPWALFLFSITSRVSVRIEPNGLCQRQASYTTTSVVVAKMQRASAAGPNDGMH